MELLQVNSIIHLEPLKLSMAEIIFETIDRERDYLKKWLPFVDYTHEVSDTKAFIKTIVSQVGQKKDDVCSVWYNHDFAGLIGFKDTDWTNRKTEIGYWLSEKMQGNGIITMCTEKLVQYAFQKLGMNRIQIKAAIENKKSTAIPKRLGFQLEGIERQGELCRNIYFDLEIYSILISEWLKKYDSKTFYKFENE